ncbi:uncharacterized protein LOC132199123 [Neocloeon triangulifer]|uniref:uncharacterized protein LOC132199123 n=1 Tax=Neocloeon triangulifer TaxID=2078957 RepID=UPI00286F8002|nr:uncharacterized protein LOC132199123 [Neocloeon triangulifer]XP_059479605.1 uncharacterized protein LOC132199123 [Neocloeon triangulifer]XP_059479606.1 uncharacterized protein LOC132199123 [Neocloeon triangulifer]
MQCYTVNTASETQMAFVVKRWAALGLASKTLVALEPPVQATPALDPNISLDPVTYLEAQLASTTLTQHPLSPDVVDKANGLLASLLTVKLAPEAKIDNAFNFVLKLMDMYKQKRLTSMKDKQLLLLHLAESSEIMSETMFPKGIKCSMCDEVGDFRSACCKRTYFCGPCSLKRGNICLMQCTWSGRTFVLS